jgi:ADP-ribose pyrophosphatase YjhB (NUDIX family)
MMAQETQACRCGHCAEHGPEHVPGRCAICGWEGECPNCGAPPHAGEPRLMVWSSRPVTADIIIPDTDGRVLLIQRAGRMAGKWALPGGYVSQQHSPAETAVKEAEEEVGITPRLDRQFYTYGAVGRDPGTPNVTVVYLAYPTADEPTANPAEVLALRWVDETQARAMATAGEIAFDHGLVLADYFHLRGRTFA